MSHFTYICEIIKFSSENYLEFMNLSQTIQFDMFRCI